MLVPTHHYRLTVGIRHRRLDSPSERVSSASVGLIYKPFGIILGILAGLLGKRLFNFAWTKIDDEDPPKATTEQRAVGQDPRRRGAAGRDLQGHAGDRRPLRRDRLALSHGCLAGREASGPGRRLTLSGSRSRARDSRRARPRSPRSPAARAVAAGSASRRAASARGGGRSSSSSCSRIRISGRRILLAGDDRDRVASRGSAAAPRPRGPAASAGGRRSEQLVLAAEDLGDGVVGEDAADRVRQQVGDATAR